MLLYMKIKGSPFSYIEHWKDYTLLGTFNIALPFLLIAISALNITASMLSILNSTTPIFVAIVGYIWINDRLSMVKISGIILGLFGVIIVVGWNPIALNSAVVLAAILSITAAINYGVSLIYIKKYCNHISTEKIVTGQLLGASIVLLPVTLLYNPGLLFNVEIYLYMLVLAIFCTALPMIMFFYLVQVIGPAVASSTLYLVPVFGTIYGIFLLGEGLRFWQVIGFILILVGIYLITQFSNKNTKEVTANTEQE